MNFKNFICKNKRIAICLVIALGIGISSAANQMPKEEYNNLLIQKEQQDSEILSLDSKLEKTSRQVNNLQDQKEEADRIAKEEAERLAREEAERKAQEEAERVTKKEAEKITQEQQNSNNYVASSGTRESVQKENLVGKMVWLSETGSKYHSINDCGRMNPAKARKVTLDSAMAQGFKACSKCY